MLPALSQVCSLQSPFPRDVEDYAAGQCRALEVWLTKLEQYVAESSLQSARDLLQQHEMRTPVASYQGGLIESQGPLRNEAWELFARRLRLCREIGIDVLVVAGDVSDRVDNQVIERTLMSLRQAAKLAGDNGVRLALEFQSGATLMNNLETAAKFVGEIQSPHLGLCLDTFHFYVGPSKTEDLRFLRTENVFHVQLCDLADVLRELASDSDRILPGEGDLPLGAILARLREIDYQNHISIELLNPQIWQVPPLQFGEIGMTALRQALGMASMGD